MLVFRSSARVSKSDKWPMEPSTPVFAQMKDRRPRYPSDICTIHNCASEEDDKHIYECAALYIDDALHGRPRHFGKGEFSNPEFHTLRQRRYDDLVISPYSSVCRAFFLHVSKFYNAALLFIIIGHLALIFWEPPSTLVASDWCMAYNCTV